MDADEWKALVDKANGNTKPYTHLVGIDPDVEKNGVCMYDRKTKAIALHNLTFFELFDFLKSLNQKNRLF